MTPLTTGVIATSRKENEDRVAIHPAQLRRIDPSLRPALRFEIGYGERFAHPIPDDFGPSASREELLATSDLVILPKPLPADLAEMKEGAVLWGWPHCVQQRETTQVAIDRRLTLVAFESMYQWSGERKGVHVLAKNNEMAGYCAVLHAFRLQGIDGRYGRPRRAVVLGFGSVSRGAIYALEGLGISSITVLTQRPAHLVGDQHPTVRHGQLRRAAGGRMIATEAHQERPLVDLLAVHDVIVNGTLQNPLDPVMFLGPGQVEELRPGTLIIDVSCDEGMGFPFARPTSFEAPTFSTGPATYYAVDHTPTYLRDAASWEISTALLPYLESVTGGPPSWTRDATIRRAIEIENGVVLNSQILDFQRRGPKYPHPVDPKGPGA